MEGFKMEDGDADVSIEQTIEIEVAAGEEVEETVELEESISESEDVAEETEQMLATLEFAAHAEAVVEEFGWSRPVAAMLNRGQNVEKGIQGDLEVFLGITMPANESLDMVSSAYDDNTVAALETFKATMEKFWKWIKEQAVKIKNFFINMWNRLVSFFMGGLKASKRIAEMVKKADIDDAKLAEKKMKLVDYDALNKATAGGVVSTLIMAATTMTDAIKQAASQLDSGRSINDIVIKRSTVEAALKPIFSSATFSEDGSVSIGKGDMVKALDIKEVSVSAAGWDKTTASKTDIAEACQKAIDKINGSKTFADAVRSIEKAALKFSKVTDGKDSDEYKNASKGAKETLKYMKNTQKFLNIISKFLSYAMR